MTTIYTTTISAAPLFEWFQKDRNNRAKLREAGYSDGRITNWKARGIPRGEVGNIAPMMGLTYEQYVTAAEIAERKGKKFRRAAAWAAVWLVVALSGAFNNKSFAATIRQVVEINTHCAFWLSVIRDRFFKAIFNVTQQLATAG